MRHGVWMGLACAVAVAVVPGGVWADEPLEGEDLVVQLSDASYARREAAQGALATLGKRAGPVLLRHRDDPDLEVRGRVRALMLILEIQSDDDKAALEAAIARVLDGPPAGREGAARAALAHGPVGAKALERALIAPEGSLALKVTGPAWIERGGEWTGKLTVTNTSTRTVLLPIEGSAPLANSWSSSWAQLVEDRPLRAGAPTGVAGGGASVHMSPPRLGGARRLAAGESLELPLPEAIAVLVQDGSVGVQTSDWSIGALRKFELDGVRYMNGIGGKTELGIVHRIVVLPPIGAPTHLQGVSLAIELPAEQRSGFVAATLVMVNAGTAAVRLDADWPRYTWVALASRDGLAIDCRTAMAFGQVAAHPTAREALDLAPGASARYAIALPAPEEVGTYWLTAAYSNVEIKANGEPLAPEAALDSTGYAQGQMLAERREIVAAEPNRLPRIERDLLALKDRGRAAQEELRARIEAAGRPCVGVLLGVLERLDHADEDAIGVGQFISDMLVELFDPEEPPGYDPTLEGDEGAASRRRAVAQWRELLDKGKLR